MARRSRRALRATIEGWFGHGNDQEHGAPEDTRRQAIHVFRNPEPRSPAGFWRRYRSHRADSSGQARASEVGNAHDPAPGTAAVHRMRKSGRIPVQALDPPAGSRRE